MDRSLITGRGGGGATKWEIAGPAPFFFSMAETPSSRVKASPELFVSPLKHGSNFFCPHSFSFNRLKLHLPSLPFCSAPTLPVINDHSLKFHPKFLMLPRRPKYYNSPSPPPPPLEGPLTGAPQCRMSN